MKQQSVISQRPLQISCNTDGCRTSFLPTATTTYNHFIPKVPQGIKKTFSSWKTQMNHRKHVFYSENRHWVLLFWKYKKVPSKAFELSMTSSSLMLRRLAITFFQVSSSPKFFWDVDSELTRKKEEWNSQTDFCWTKCFSRSLDVAHVTCSLLQHRALHLFTRAGDIWRARCAGTPRSTGF